MSKHTTGNWELIHVLKNVKPCLDQIVSMGQGVLVLQHDGSSEAQANAVLCAASPDLLACTELALHVEEAMLADLIEGGEQEDGMSVQACRKNIAQYKAAIQKARGG